MKYLILGLLYSAVFACSPIKKSLQSQVKGVRIVRPMIDRDGYVTARWVYADRRIGGTDWTDKDTLLLQVEQQRLWPKCKKCRHVTLNGTCWRHFPIPNLNR